MSNKNRVIKSVAFDLTDELETELLAHAEKEFNGKKRNFSRYVKRLIQADKVSGGAIENPKVVIDRGYDKNENYTIEI